MTWRKACEEIKENGNEHRQLEYDYNASVKRGLSGFLIVLSCTRVIFDITTHPGKKAQIFNKYTLMYRKVAKRFLKLLCVYCFFILSFSLGFYVLFHNNVGGAKSICIIFQLSI